MRPEVAVTAEAVGPFAHMIRNGSALRVAWITKKGVSAMSASCGRKEPLGHAERVLATLLGLGFVLGFVLTPLGVETRRKSLRTPVFAAFFIMVGLLMPLAGLILLFRRPRLAAVVAVIDAALLFLTAPADQARFFFTVAPPPAVTAGEIVLTLLGTGYVVYGTRVYAENSGGGRVREPNE